MNYRSRRPMNPIGRLGWSLVPVILIGGFFRVSGSENRAPDWKPVYEMKAEKLSLSEIKYLIIPQVQSEQLASALADLRALFKQRYGKTLQLSQSPNAKQSICFETFRIGEGGAFSIRKKRTRVFIRGADPEAWANGIYTICRDLLGARWYWSGELGFEWIPPRLNHFPNRALTRRPAFIQRHFGPIQQPFGYRNRLNSIYSFNHNLARIFNSKLFRETPEVFSRINGRRRNPKGSAGRDPQPDFSNPLTVEVAARATIEYFTKNPSERSFSLSINDNVLFDTSERTRRIVSPLRYFRGRPNYTDLVFAFVNRVAERVFDQAGLWETPSGEPRYLGALAYYWTEAAPSIPLHPRVMPVLTSDRAQWRDPGYQTEDKTLIEEWMRSGAERVATWDYYFGAPYLYPRQMNQWIDESLKYLNESGVDVFFSELPLFFGLDGAKAWLASELLWDPHQDASDLLDEYYQNFFGAAAENIRAFYETAESYRNKHEGPPHWIKLYKDEFGIALFDQSILGKMRGYISQAENQVATDERRLRRVRVVSEAFRLTELYERYNYNRQALVWMALRRPNRTSALKNQLAEFKHSKTAYTEYMDDYLKESAYAPPRNYINIRQSDPEALALAAISGAGSDDFTSLLKDPLLQHRGSNLRNFLGPQLPRLADWYLDYRPNEKFTILPSRHSEENSGLHILHADILSIFKTFPVTAGTSYALKMQADWRIGLDNRVQVHVTWLDAAGKSLKRFIPIRFPIGSSGKPLKVYLPLNAPEHASDVKIRIILSRQYPEDYFDLSRLDFGRTQSPASL